MAASWGDSTLGRLARRGLTLGAVVLLHVAVLALLAATGSLPPMLLPVLPARLILTRPAAPPKPPRIEPRLEATAMVVPVPEIRLAAPAPVQVRAPVAVARAAPAQSHFGAAGDSGLGLDVAASGGGGAGARGSLAGFEAAVRARVLAGKRQPALAWDRRNTCVVNYRVRVARGGALVDFSIDPCAEPEINAAARAAIRGAAPFPPPPDLGAPHLGASGLGAAVAEVHGSLIFHP